MKKPRSHKPLPELTPERFLALEGCGHYTTEEAEEIIRTLWEFSRLTYRFYQLSKTA